MRKLFPLILLPAILSLGLITKDCSNPIEAVIYAQSLPATVHCTWVPSVVDASHPAPLQYSVVTDGGTPVVVQLSSCTPTLCTATLTINSFGSHSTVVSAQYLSISSDPNSLTDVPANAISWVLNNSANAVTNQKIVK